MFKCTCTQTLLEPFGSRHVSIGIGLPHRRSNLIETLLEPCTSKHVSIDCIVHLSRTNSTTYEDLGKSNLINHNGNTIPYISNYYIHMSTEILLELFGSKRVAIGLGLPQRRLNLIETILEPCGSKNVSIQGVLQKISTSIEKLLKLLDSRNV